MSEIFWVGTGEQTAAGLCGSGFIETLFSKRLAAEKSRYG